MKTPMNLNQKADMVRSNFKAPEDPLPDACLAISSEE